MRDFGRWFYYAMLTKSLGCEGTWVRIRLVTNQFGYQVSWNHAMKWRHMHLVNHKLQVMMQVCLIIWCYLRLMITFSKFSSAMPPRIVYVNDRYVRYVLGHRVRVRIELPICSTLHLFIAQCVIFFLGKVDAKTLSKKAKKVEKRIDRRNKVSLENCRGGVQDLGK